MTDDLLRELTTVPEVTASRDDTLPSLDELMEMPKGASALVVALMAQSQRDYAYTSGAVIESLQRDLNEARATLAAIRTEADVLLSGNWMPTPDAIREALWPSDKIIDEYRRPEEAT